MKMKVLKLHPDAILPSKAREGDLGYDLHCINSFHLYPEHGVVKIHTGISIQFPDDWGGLIQDRSSLAAEGLAVSGGVIDNGYVGEIIVLMRNTRSFATHYFGKGQKIAQIVPVLVTDFEVEQVDRMLETVRGDKGFGSSGA